MRNTTKTIQVYNEGSETYKMLYAKPSDSARIFLSHVPKKSLILEVGCGPGVDANYLTNNGLSVIATDASENMVITAQKTYPQIDFRVTDMRDLPFNADIFDGIFAESCLLHIPKKDISKTLTGFYRVLKTGGILELGLQEGLSQEAILPSPFPPEKDVLVNIFSYDESHSLLKKHGFSIIQEFHKNPQRGQHPFKKRKIFAKKMN